MRRHTENSPKRLFHWSQNSRSYAIIPWLTTKRIDTLRPRQNGHHFADDVFKGNFLNENVWNSVKKKSLKFVPKVPINDIPVLVHTMVWCRSRDKPLSEPIMVSLLTHICVTRPPWANQFRHWWRYMTSQNLVIIGSGIRDRPITWTNVDFLS